MKNISLETFSPGFSDNSNREFGKAIYSNALNTSFPGLTGNFKLQENGDRLPETLQFFIYRRNTSNKDKRCIIRRFEKKQFTSDTFCQLSNQSKSTRSYKQPSGIYVKNAHIYTIFCRYVYTYTFI